MAWKPTYCTTDELSAFVRIDDDVDDVQIDLAVEAASRAIDRETNRQFGATESTEERVYEAEWSPRRGIYIAKVDDIMTATGLVVDVAGSPITSYGLFPRNAAFEGRLWERIHTTVVTPDPLGSGPSTVEVTATFGWTAVPDTIKNACLVQASRFLKRRDSPFGVAGSPELGNELRLLAKVDADVAVMVTAYRRDAPMVG